MSIQGLLETFGESNCGCVPLVRGLERKRGGLFGCECMACALCRKVKFDINCQTTMDVFLVMKTVLSPFFFLSYL